MNILIFETKATIIAGERIIPVDSTVASINGDVYWRTDSKDSFHVRLDEVSDKVLKDETYFKRIY